MVHKNTRLKMTDKIYSLMSSKLKRNNVKNSVHSYRRKGLRAPMSRPEKKKIMQMTYEEPR